MSRSLLTDMEIDEASLSSNRRLKIARLKNEGALGLSLCAELALQKALKKYIAVCSGDKPEEVQLPLQIEERGKSKPYFAPQSPYHNKLYFSLSHAGDYAAAVVTDHEIGMDLEQIRGRIPRLSEKILNEQDYATLSLIEDENAQWEFFYKRWTQIESYMKLTGEGIYLKIKNTQVHNDRVITSSEHPAIGYIYPVSSNMLPCGYKCNICTTREEEIILYTC